MTDSTNLRPDQVVPKLQVAEDGEWVTTFPEMRQILSEAQLPNYPLDRVEGLIVVRSFSGIGRRKLIISEVYAVRAGDTDKYDNCYLLYSEREGFISPTLPQEFYAPELNLRELLETPPQPLTTADPEGFEKLKTSIQAWIEAFKAGNPKLKDYRKAS